MKLSITDKFLWDMYSVLEKAENVSDFVLSNKYKKASILMGGQNPFFEKYRKDMGKRRFNKLVSYLKKKNYIKAKNLENKKAFMITKDGLSKALKASFAAGDKRKRKDSKWVMMIFDIPEKHRTSRNLLGSILYNLGYKLLQQSVWVTPYDVSEKTEQLLQLHSLDHYVKMFVIEKV